MSRWHPFIAVMQAAENFAYRRADKVVSMLPKAECHMREHGLAPASSRTSQRRGRRSVGEKRRAAAAHAQEALAAFRQRFRFLIGYAGSHGVANALETLLDAAAVGQERTSGIRAGRTGTRKGKTANARGAIGPAQCPLPRASEEGVHSNVLDPNGRFVHWLAPKPAVHVGVSPNKLMDYMMSGKPVVHSIEGANDSLRNRGAESLHHRRIPPPSHMAYDGWRRLALTCAAIWSSGQAVYP